MTKKLKTTPKKSTAPDAAKRIMEAATEDFVELIALSGLDPELHLRFADWSGVSFRGCDLRGFDFTGARLHYCDFTDALIQGASFDQAEMDYRGSNPRGRTNLRAAKDWDGYLHRWNKSSFYSDNHLPVGSAFFDAPFSPEMIVIPSGRLIMGSPGDEIGRNSCEGPQHEVKLPRRIAVARYPLTFWEWDYAAQNGGMEGYCPDDEGWGRGRQPVINVSWEDAQSYLDWLTRTTGKQYRLLTEAEWEYCCRSGSDEAYCFGKNRNTLHKYAWFEENLSGKTYSVGGKEPNAWGLYDMHGNVLERVQDDWHRSYSDKPEELRENGHIPWILGGHGRHVVRGGFSSPANLRCAHRELGISGTRVSGCGFRVARELIL